MDSGGGGVGSGGWERVGEVKYWCGVSRESVFEDHPTSAL